MIQTGLPDGSGSDIANELRNGAYGESMRHVKVVVVSADATDTTLQAFSKLSNVSYAFKPFSVNSIANAVALDSPV